MHVPQQRPNESSPSVPLSTNQQPPPVAATVTPRAPRATLDHDRVFCQLPATIPQGELQSFLDERLRFTTPGQLLHDYRRAYDPLGPADDHSSDDKKQGYDSNDANDDGKDIAVAESPSTSSIMIVAPATALPTTPSTEVAVAPSAVPTSVASTATASGMDDAVNAELVDPEKSGNVNTLRHPYY
jgi:hypothetical protein